MYKYVFSIIFVSSVLTGLNIIPGITTNLTHIEQLQSEQKRPLEPVVCQSEAKADSGEGLTSGDKPADPTEDITPGNPRDGRQEKKYKYTQNLTIQTDLTRIYLQKTSLT